MFTKLHTTDDQLKKIEETFVKQSGQRNVRGSGAHVAMVCVGVLGSWGVQSREHARSFMMEVGIGMEAASQAAQQGEGESRLG